VTIGPRDRPLIGSAPQNLELRTKNRSPWGDEFKKDGELMANIHQGQFPNEDTGADRFTGVAPVAQFPPNGYGLYDQSSWQ
jgi:formylglycine-generating enzyme required for sulfatase activity